MKIWESWIGRWWTNVTKRSQDLALKEKEECMMLEGEGKIVKWNKDHVLGTVFQFLLDKHFEPLWKILRGGFGEVV